MAGVERKLTTILAADVTGYSRMMGEDEPGTLATLKSYRETMAGFIASHRGRVVNTAGDSLLAEFASVVFAVNMLSDSRDLWFQWPALAVVILFAFRALRLFGPGRDEAAGGNRPRGRS